MGGREGLRRVSVMVRSDPRETQAGSRKRPRLVVLPGPVPPALLNPRKLTLFPSTASSASSRRVTRTTSCRWCTSCTAISPRSCRSSALL